MSERRTTLAELGALLILGALGLYGGLGSYLGMDARMQSSSLKPGMFVIALAGLLVTTSFIYGAVALRSARSSHAVPAVDEEPGSFRIVAVSCATMVAYAALIPLAGYAAATLIFLIAQFRLLGVESWLRNLLLSIATAALFYVLFVHYAEMTFPHGAWFG